MTVVRNPCRNICRYDNDRVCSGCYRTMEEATGWIHMTDAQKLQVLENIPIRKTRIRTLEEDYERYV
ncbi:MAG: DUF1289 domain-containing protein [Bacteroidales bacterium]|nr:DUF1289 domain-containing protein [Bacteroidales bacterium]